MSLFRRHRPSPLRYFVYVSDAKLDMLFEQIDPAQRRRLSAEVKVDLKLASLTLRRAEQPAAARMAKLRIVESYIDANHHVGTVAEPGREFFRGRLRMQWGWLGPAGSGLSAVFFRGRQDREIVALAGSRSHVLGQHPAGDEDKATIGVEWSTAPGFFGLFSGHIVDLGGPQRHRDIPIEAREFHPSLDACMKYVASNLRLPPSRQELEFLAVPLIEAPVRLGGMRFHEVSGTPIYVAHTR